MIRQIAMQAGVLLAFVALSISSANANLRYVVDDDSDGGRSIVVVGAFAHNDDLSEFSTTVRQHDPSFISFHSPGGNLVKAMEFGRLIRSHGLDTLQLRGRECSSACAIAFMGGVSRFAEPGAIGVHKSSFVGIRSLDPDQAVSAVQHMTALIITYMIEMGIDPALLRLALKYESDDVRYLSRSEMTAYRVVTTGATGTRSQGARRPAAPRPRPGIAARSSPSARNASPSIPDARTGRVRHPHGAIALKAEPGADARVVALIRNGTRIAIVNSHDRWYGLEIVGRGLRGYMHDSWVAIDQFDSGHRDERYIQIKSFHGLSHAEAYVRSSAVPLSVYLATNGWFAVTLNETYDGEAAAALVRSLSAQGAIPDDSFMTYGNTYARKVCCE